MASTDLSMAGRTAQETIPAVVRALMAARRVTGPDLAGAVGMSPSSFYERLNGKSVISAGLVAQLAAYFEVPVSFLYDPPDGLKTRNFWMWPPLKVPA